VSSFGVRRSGIIPGICMLSLLPGYDPFARSRPYGHHAVYVGCCQLAANGQRVAAYEARAEESGRFEF